MSLVKTALEADVAVGEVSLSAFSKVFETIAIGGEVVGTALDMLNLGLDIYELWTFDGNDIDKAALGIKFTFDLAASQVAAAAFGAGLAGAAGVATAFTAAGVLIAGLGIGVAELVVSYGNMAARANNVGDTIATIYDAYKGGGYKYETKDDNRELVPLAGAVVNQIEMGHKGITVGFDSHYIYRTDHSGGSGSSNYFWPGHMPTLNKKRSEAINLKDGIGCKENSRIVEFDGRPDCLILPATPKAFISYDYEALPFATTSHHRGYDLLRGLEEDGRFDFDFYVFLSEYIITHLYFEYVKTRIAVVLDKRSIRLQMFSHLDKVEEVQRNLSYDVEGAAGGEYCIGLVEGSYLAMTLSLNASGSDAGTKTTWIIDASSLKTGNVEVGNNFVKIGGNTITVSSEKFDGVWLIKPGGDSGERSLVNFETKQLLVQYEDGSKWNNKNETILQHLEKLAQEHKLAGEFVVVDNYEVQEKEKERPVGRAYFDVSGDRMLYTDAMADVGLECEVVFLNDIDSGKYQQREWYTEEDAVEDAIAAKNAVLGAVVGNDAYFFHSHNNCYTALWRVNAETHRITAKYYISTLSEDPNFKISGVSRNGEFVTLAISRTHHAGEGLLQIIYIIREESMVLSTVIGNKNMFKRINESEGSLSLNDLVGGMQTSKISALKKLKNQAFVLPSIADIVTVVCKDGVDSDQFCCWLRTSDSTIIRSSLPNPPRDLILTTSSYREDGYEMFYLYSVENGFVYCQQGSFYSNFTRITIPGLTNLFTVQGEVFATTKEGRISRLPADRSNSVYLEAVNEDWLAQHKTWWLDLPGLEGKKSTSISVFGVRDSNNRVVPVWYQDGKVVIASPELLGNQLRFLGLCGNEQVPLLFDRENGHLYKQPVTSGAMDAMFDSDGKLISDKIPEAKIMVGNERIKEPAMMDGYLRVTTESGIILVVDGHLEMGTLVAVNMEWQKSTNLEAGMETLADIWPHGDMVVLLDDSDDSKPAWFHLASAETVRVQGLKMSDHPMWMGMSTDGATFYIYVQSSGFLYAIDRERKTMIEKGKFTAAKVQGNSLVLQCTSPNAEINIPTLIGLDFAVVSASNAKTVVIDEENWNHYKVITIDNISNEGSRERMVEINHSGEHLVVHIMGSNMVFVDGSRGSSVNVANVLAKEAEQGSYKVKVRLGIDEEEFTISDFRDCLGKAHPFLKDGIFSIAEIIALIKDNPQ
ncbi:hypothetical protein KI387_028467 [Taxus chinensis]|uniref:TcdA/TcdB toxin pore forming domain-containing protein n=1 Tax=Taxus chinensis TaxID=29808 RepID=A0AA38FC46_TAXCH|nr:hypothetical protein KI387_028467 [Taxus chinensis]